MKRIFFIFAVVALAFGLRLYNVQNNPPSLSWDEVSIGYNAYSILLTGKDEHGRTMPLDTFAAYGDYKPPVPIYVTVPFVALFGLNELAVRLPSVLFGTGIVLLMYLVALELFYTSTSKISHRIALISSLSVAISPWHINLSRAGFEANIGLFFILLGFFFALLARKRPVLWICVWLPFVAAIYTFNSSRYFVPFLGLGLAAYVWKSMTAHKKYVFAGIIIALIALVPILPHLLSKESRLRFIEVNIFTDQSVVIRANAQTAFDGNSWVAKLLHNRRIGYVRSFLIHYFDHFSPEFLFIKGDGNPKFSTQDVGQFYILDALFLFIGLYFLFRDFRKEAFLISYWLVTAIIPAATARETPHALRILNSLPAWHLMIGVGVALFITEILKKRRTIFCIVLAVLYLLSLSYYLHNYYVHYPRIYSSEWQYGYKQALDYINLHNDDYKKVYLSESIGRAYMYALFYTRYDPNEFLRTKKSYFDAAGFYHVDGFGTYVFTKTAPANLEDDSVYIYPPGQEPKGAKLLQTIPLLSGDPVLTIFEKG